MELIKELIEKKQYSELKELLKDKNAVDAAEVFEGLDEKEVVITFRLLPKDAACDVFAEMEFEAQAALIHSLTDNQLKELFEELSADDAADFLGEMPPNVVKRILRNTDSETRKYINELLHYPETSVGSIMTPEFVSLRPDMTVEDAFDRIRRVGLNKETVYTCYITHNRKLLGVISVRSLLVAEKDVLISDLMHENIVYVTTEDTREFAASQIKKYGFLALPVVDKDGLMVGIVTIDDAIDVIEEEATEDIQIMSAMSPDETPYLKSGVFSIWKQRIPWLLLLMVSSSVTSAIIGKFEAALSACIVLSSFIPMIMGTGGNAGSQSSVTVIRGLSLGEIKVSNILQIIWKEFRVSIICGLTLLPVTFLKVMFVDGLSVEPDGVIISVVIAVTLVATVFVAKLVGCVLPLIAKLLKLDPAVMASPFITTVVDAISLVVYFAFASNFVPALT